LLHLAFECTVSCTLTTSLGIVSQTLTNLSHEILDLERLFKKGIPHLLSACFALSAQSQYHEDHCWRANRLYRKCPRDWLTCRTTVRVEFLSWDKLAVA